MIVENGMITDLSQTVFIPTPFGQVDLSNMFSLELGTFIVPGNIGFNGGTFKDKITGFYEGGNF